MYIMPRELRKIKKLSLYRSLALGYLRNEKKQAKRLKKFGYLIDRDLTDNQHLVARNAFNGQILYVNNGSQPNPLDLPQFVSDWRTDIMNIPSGTFQYTPRAIQDKNTYLKIKEKYGKDVPVKFVGHSLGAVSVNELTQKGDKGYTLNGALIKQKDNPNVTNYRIKNDVVSMFANPNDIRTLQGESKNPFVSHAIENIKNEPIFL